MPIKLKRFAFYWLPLILYCLFIYIQSDHPSPEGWDGTHNGALLPQDVYVWKASAIFEDGSAWQGMDDGNGGFKTMGSLILLR